MKTAQLLIIVLIFSPLLSFAATLHVPQDFPTVQAAVAASVAGDTILVSPGLYVIPGVPSTILPGTVGLELHDGTTLAGSGPAQTVLEFAGADAGIVPLGTATVKLLHLRKATTAIYAYVGSNITVTNVIITELTGTNVFGIELNQGSSYTIHNNTIDNIHQTNDPVGTAIDVPFGGVSDIQNNLLTSNTHGVTAGSFSGGTYTYNDVFGSTSADWSTCDANGCSAVSAPASNISADPLYCPDFSLQTASPARNAGNPAILNPDGTRSDLGAYGGPAAILPPTTCGGTGQPAVSVSPTQIPFPPTPLNTTSVPVTVTVSNPGTATLSISDISTQDPFKILNFSSNVVTGIAPNTSGTFDATFSPKVQGTMFSSVMISSNATSSPTLSIPLSGTGSPSGKRVFVSWTAGQVLQFILLKETKDCEPPACLVRGTADDRRTDQGFVADELRARARRDKERLLNNNFFAGGCASLHCRQDDQPRTTGSRPRFLLACDIRQPVSCD